MSRSGYSEDYFDNPAAFLWIGAVQSALNGKRGQQFLRDLIAALDALPKKRLIADNLITFDGEVCALGSVGKARGINMREIDPNDRDQVAEAFNIAPAMAAEIMYQNDDEFNYAEPETPERRWQRVRDWAASELKEPV